MEGKKNNKEKDDIDDKRHIIKKDQEKEQIDNF